jgi:hypothetical protein
MSVAGHLLTRNGDAMNTSISPAPDAADLLALPGSMTTGHRQR